MRKKSVFLVFTLLFGSLSLLVAPESLAAKVGSSCSKVNSKSWDGETPIVCKKNTKGKLVWTLFSSNSGTNTKSGNSNVNVAAKNEAISQLISFKDKISDSEKKLTSATVSYYENLCKGSLFATAAQTWKSAADSYERAIQSYLTASNKIIERFPDLKSYAPTRVQSSITSTCTTSTSSQTSSSSSQTNSSSAKPGESIGQFNARKSASSYLNSSGFSRSGLLKQLKYEGYSDSDASYGVDAQNADWKTQATRSAAAYLRSSGFSRSGLIKQLEYEGFSNEEAVYGVNFQNADWFDQAVRSAAAYLKSSSFSRSGLIKQLEYEGFTNAEAVYGVDSNGYASTQPQKPSNSSSNSSNPSTNSATNIEAPTVGRIVSGTDWAAYEISNPSATSIFYHPSYTVTASTAAGAILIEGRNDKFPMLAPGAKTWMYLPYSQLLYGGSPGKVTLAKYDRSNSRPSVQTEWPTVTNVQLAGTQIQFNLTNNSKTSRLSGESIYYYFCLDASGTPVFADQSLTYTTLLPGGSTAISWPTKMKLGQCASVVVAVGAVYTS